MNLAALVLVSLSNDGHWFGGSKATIGFQWAVRDNMPAAALTWRLQAGDVSIAEGQDRLATDGPLRQSQVELPRVRAPVEARLIWRVDRLGRANNKTSQDVLAQGSAVVHLYPPTLLAGSAALLTGKRLLVWDRREGLPAVLAKEQITVQVVSDEDELAFIRADILIVAADRLSGHSAAQQRVKNLAAAGASVLILSQSGCCIADGVGKGSPIGGQLVGYTLTRRQLPPKLQWRHDHPLARHLQLAGGTESDRGSDRSVWAIRLPADDAALEIVWWPPEVLGHEPATVDVMVVTKAVQKGRITLCQLQLGPWDSDPRSQMFLADAIDYLVSPVVPTPPLAQRYLPSEDVLPARVGKKPLRQSTSILEGSPQ